MYPKKKNVNLCTNKNRIKNVNKKHFRKKKNLVFTKVFNFLGGRFELTHAFSHYCLSFLDFFAKLCISANLLRQFD